MEHYAFPRDCINYYICINGQIYQDQCPAGLAFDPDSSVCVDPARVDNCSHVAGNRKYNANATAFARLEVEHPVDHRLKFLPTDKIARGPILLAKPRRGPQPVGRVA